MLKRVTRVLTLVALAVLAWTILGVWQSYPEDEDVEWGRVADLALERIGEIPADARDGAAQAYKFLKGVTRPPEGEKPGVASPDATEEGPPQPTLRAQEVPGTRAAPTPLPTSLADEPSVGTPAPPETELGYLRQYMLDLINEDRQIHGLSPVSLGDNAAAQRHAEDMLENNYVSHWGRDGLLPYMRYTLAGGVNYVAENVSGPAMLEEGVRYREQSPEDSLEESQEGLMNSPGHRRNILNQWHKKVNLGIACNDTTCSVVQQFEGDYVEFDEGPAISSGVLSFKGTMKGGFSLEGADVWYHQPLHPLTLGQLDATFSYGVGQRPATFLRPPLSGDRYYTESRTEYTWVTGIDPYTLDPETPRSDSPPPRPSIPRSVMVPWTTAAVWEASGQEFRVEADISPVISGLGAGVYTVTVWGEVEGESVGLTNYSIFIE